MSLAFEKLRCAIGATVRRGGRSWADAYLDALGQRALHALERGALPDAEACCLYVLGRNPAQGRAMECARALAAVWSGKGNVHVRASELNEARDCFEKAIALVASADAHISLGDVYLSAGHADEARSHYQQALHIAPDSARALSRLGAAAAQAGDASEAERLLVRAHDLAPGELEPLINLGLVSQELGRVDQALEYYRRARAIDPICVEAHMYAGLSHLSRGELREGWDGLEWRLRLPSLQSLRAVDRPLWRGEAITGCTVFLQREPGLGDHIQFLRYVPMLVSSGARVVVETFPELQRLVARMPAVQGTVSGGDDSAREAANADWRCPILSLPQRFGTTSKTIPASVPYFAADQTGVVAWKGRLGQLPAGAKIGFAWSDGTSPEDELGQLHTSATKAVFIALQPVPQDGSSDLIDWASHMRDYADMADLISTLDLVIGPPAVATHLAGAMGAPTWILVRAGRGGDWRWTGDTSAWYPTARVFRQATPGSWKNVAAALAEFRPLPNQGRGGASVST